jgi:hypothetical protein
VFLVGAVVLSGRRKILVEIVLYVAMFGSLLLYFRRGAGKLALYSAVLGIMFFLVGNQYISSRESPGIIGYVDRRFDLQEDMENRFYSATVRAFGNVVARNGFFGAGAGMGSQGSQYFGGGSAVVGWSAEGGIAKLLAELGVPGLALFTWLSVAAARYFWYLMRRVSSLHLRHARLTYGLAAFLGTAIVVYAVAHQAYGDAFVLQNIGWGVGFLVAMPKVIDQAGADSDSAGRGS